MKSLSITVEASEIERISTPSPPAMVSTDVKAAVANEKVSIPPPPVKLDFSVPAVIESAPAPPVTLIVAVLFSLDVKVRAAAVLVKAEALTVNA